MRTLLDWFFRDLKIQTRMILANVILVIIPMIIVLALFADDFTETIKDSVLQIHESASLNVQKDIEKEVGIVNILCRDMASTVDFTELFGVTASYESLSLLQYKIQDAKTQGHISDIVIYVKEDTQDVTSVLDVENRTLFRSMDEIRQVYWKTVLDAGTERSLIAPNSYLSEAKRATNEEYAVVQKHAYMIEGEMKYAYIVLYGPLEVFQDIFEESIGRSQIIAYMVNERDSIVVSSDRKQHGVHWIDYDDIPEIISGEGSFENRTVLDEQVFLSYRDISGIGWRLVWTVPQSDIIRDSAELSTRFVCVFFFLVIAGFIISTMISKAVTKRIGQLKSQMEYVRLERPQVPAESFGRDEIGELMEAYVFMAKRINLLMDRELQTAEELHALKLHALNAQIDPHFLYNTLDMIKWKINANRKDDAIGAVIALSRFYRLTLNKGNLMGTVAEEIEHIRLYVELVNMRFGNKVDFLIDVPDEIMECVMPMIIFQPIVENSIQHGIFEKDSQQGSIAIIGWLDESNLNFIISDDGIGMSEEMLADILRKRSLPKKGSGFGVYSTHRRIRMLFEDASFGLEYRKGPDVGIEVEICIPRLYSDKE